MYAVYNFVGEKLRTGGMRGTIRTTYRDTGDGQWVVDSQTTWSNGQVEAYPREHYTETRTQWREIELAHDRYVPVKLTPGHSYMWRTYPTVPTPTGIDPNLVAWWPHSGSGNWDVWVTHRTKAQIKYYTSPINLNSPLGAPLHSGLLPRETEVRQLLASITINSYPPGTGSWTFSRVQTPDLQRIYVLSNDLRSCPSHL